MKLKKNTIKEKDLVNLGFNKEKGDLFYYYVKDITNVICLISCANDEVKNNDEWFVQLFNDESIEISELDMLKKYIDINEHIKK